MHVQPKPFFLDTPGGQRFCQLHAATQTVARGHVVCVHAFAEEMNKSRRMVALQARALCAAGFDVLLIDLQGCGDSAGDFGDATWQGWVDDVMAATAWMAARGPTPLWIWGLRAGCLVAVEASRQMANPCKLVFWAPTPSGKSLLQQFLRLKAAGDMLGGQAKTIMDGLRQQLAEGQAVEVAGYSVSAALANGLERATLDPVVHVSGIEWLELSTRADASLTPVASKTMAQWQQAGVPVRARIVSGPSFWQTTEIEEAPELIEATVAALLNPVTQPAAETEVAV
ncbi:MAG: hydrolase 2, exosortase system-associated [Rhodoferax sp.]|nr:hydrolase 2, exosortase system-associated [Rhodoferax sp.]